MCTIQRRPFRCHPVENRTISLIFASSHFLPCSFKGHRFYSGEKSIRHCLLGSNDENLECLVTRTVPQEGCWHWSEGEVLPRSLGTNSWLCEEFHRSRGREQHRGQILSTTIWTKARLDYRRPVSIASGVIFWLMNILHVVVFHSIWLQTISGDLRAFSLTSIDLVRCTLNTIRRISTLFADWTCLKHITKRCVSHLNVRIRWVVQESVCYLFVYGRSPSLQLPNSHIASLNRAKTLFSISLINTSFVSTESSIRCRCLRRSDDWLENNIDFIRSF